MADVSYEVETFPLDEGKDYLLVKIYKCLSVLLSKYVLSKARDRIMHITRLFHMREKLQLNILKVSCIFIIDLVIFHVY